MAQTPMYLFTKEDTDKLLQSLNVVVKEIDEEKVILNPTTNLTAECECCRSKITTSNLGSISHSSTKFYCKNPACFSQLVASKRLW